MKMTFLIDFLAVTGGLLVVAGVYLQLGLAIALVVAGFLLIAFALKAAKVIEDSNVPDVG